LTLLTLYFAEKGRGKRKEKREAMAASADASPHAPKEELDFSKAHDFQYKSTWAPVTPMMAWMSSFCAFLCPKIPKTVDPNDITVFGNFQFTLLALFLMVFPPMGEDSGLGLFFDSILMLLLAVSTVARVVADWVDGMHARATGQTSVVGSFLDHALDAVNIAITLHLLIISLATPEWYWVGPLAYLTNFATMTGMLCGHWHASLTNALAPSEVGEVLFGWAAPLCFILQALFGYGYAGIVGQVLAVALFVGGSLEIIKIAGMVFKDNKSGDFTPFVYLAANRGALLLAFLVHGDYSSAAWTHMVIVSTFTEGFLVNDAICSLACGSQVLLSYERSGFPAVAAAPLFFAVSPPAASAVAFALWFQRFWSQQGSIHAGKNLVWMSGYWYEMYVGPLKKVVTVAPKKD
jgi:phosphatidylglycerophosphate synthase